MKNLIIILFCLCNCTKVTSKKTATTSVKKAEIVKEIEFDLLATVLNNLNIKKENCKLDLIAFKENPIDANETIIAIPEISKQDKNDPFYFEFNSHIVIANTHTGEIKHKYFESAKTNQWISDAVLLATIEIDTAPYMVTETKRAFGVSLYFYNNSKPNPYSSKKNSLFVPKGNSLDKILNHYTTMEYGGEWDTDCYGEFLREDKILIMADKKNNGYFDMLIKNKITETKKFRDKDDNCDTATTSETITSLLTYDGKEYKAVIQH